MKPHFLLMYALSVFSNSLLRIIRSFLPTMLLDLCFYKSLAVTFWTVGDGHFEFSLFYHRINYFIHHIASGFADKLRQFIS